MNDTDAIIEPLRAEPSRSAILCDVDGTLAPIVEDPDAAAVPAQTRAVLVELAGRYRLVACITGRRASAARRMVGLDQLTYAANRVARRIPPPRRLASLGLRLEDKGPIQAIHWRGAPDEAVAEQRAQGIASLASTEGLVPHFGRRVLEVRPVAEVHKGVAARRLVEASGVDRAMFAGDDQTDRDAFTALRALERGGSLERAVCIAIASAEGPEELQREADAVVSGPTGFRELLRSL